MKSAISKWPGRAATAQWGGIVVCAAALAAMARPTLFAPTAFVAKGAAEKTVRALWFAMTHYYVDYGRYPALPAAFAEPPACLTTPVAYVVGPLRDPYSAATAAIIRESEPRSGRALVWMSAWIAAVLIARLMAAVWRLEKRPAAPGRLAGEGLAAALALAGWVVAAWRLWLGFLGVVLMGTIVLGACGLFALRGARRGALGLAAFSACALALSLAWDRALLWWIALAAGFAAALHAALSWSEGAERRAAGKAKASWLDREWRGRHFARAMCAYAVVLSWGALLALGQANLGERARARARGLGSAPLAVSAWPDFFIVSSNGPDFRRDWRSEALSRILSEQGPRGAGRRLVERTYDPTNGANSSGDILRFGGVPQAQ